MPETWIFMDAGDTFIMGYPTLYDAIRDCCARVNHAVSIDAIQRVLHGAMKTDDRAALLYQEQFEQYLRQLYREVLIALNFPGNVDAGCDYLWGEWRGGHRLRLFDDAHAALANLKKHNFQLGIISNWDTSLEGLLRRFGVSHFFDLLVVSCQVHLAKPDPAIFNLAINTVGAEADRCWYLGDHREMDIIPASQLGMKTVYVDYYQKKKADDMADFLAPSLS
ncbi:HAD-IA family hydrolase, partial [bacterium]|nr:HAD-IA family hydrolase [bacterium]